MKTAVIWFYSTQLLGDRTFSLNKATIKNGEKAYNTSLLTFKAALLATWIK